MVDSERMRELFALLTKTCVLAAPPGTKVRIVAQEKVPIQNEWYIRVQFSHEGKGYSQEECQHLFDPFFLFRETLKQAPDGLDLTNCFIIAAKHGCELRAESDNHHGVTFTLDLPTVAPRVSSQSQDKKAA